LAHTNLENDNIGDQRRKEFGQKRQVPFLFSAARATANSDGCNMRKPVGSDLCESMLMALVMCAVSPIASFAARANVIFWRFFSSWNHDKIFPNLPGSFPGIRFSTWNEHDVRNLGDYYKLFAFHYQSERFE
jgi:hypothetical protein